jgi:hypothetical protein
MNEMTMKDIAASLVHHVHGTFKLHPSAIEKDWEYCDHFQFKDLETLARHIVYGRGYFKFEVEVLEIQRYLEVMIKPKPGPVVQFFRKLFKR